MSSDNTNLTATPWRDFINWDESVEDRLQELIKIFVPGLVADSEKPFFNILLTGIVASGKSALVNSISSMFRRRVLWKTEAGDSGCRQLTTQYRMHELRSGSKHDPLPWRIGDTPGIVLDEEEVENQIKNILQIVDGHVPDGYEFDVWETFDSDSERFITAPSPSCKIDCVVIVISASGQRSILEENLLRILRRGLRERGIPTFVMLTKVDYVCQDVKDVYRSTRVRDLVSRISKTLLNLPLHNILPVVNYADQIETDNDIDILLMESFCQLVGAKQRKRKNLKRKITEFVPATKSGKTLPFCNVLIVGQIGSGKSTFFNGINAILTNRMVTTKAEAGLMAKSLTKEFRMYEIAAPEKGKVLSTRICDIFGLKEEADDDTDVRNVLTAINGHVPDKYTFTEKEFHQECLGYIASPLLENKAHCVCIAIDAGKVVIMYENVWRKLRSVCTAAKNRGIPVKILLMKIDTVLDDNASIEKIHLNEKACRVKQIVQKKLRCKIKKEDIFPIKNYVKEIEFDVEMDILILDSLLHMLKCAKNYLKTK